jgi:hypothetical protein
MWDIRTPGFTRGYFHLLPNGRIDCGKTSFILSRVGLAGGRLTQYPRRQDHT